MVERLSATGHIKSQALRDALVELPRWGFLPVDAEGEAVARSLRDRPVAIHGGQTISAPHMVAILVEAAAPQPGDRCLEVGAGSGWLAAVVAKVVGAGGHLYALEVVPELVELADHNIRDHGLEDRVTVVHSDGSLGYPDQGPYDVIIVSCAAPEVPEPLTEQLAIGGRLVVPVGDRTRQELLRVTRTADGGFDEARLGGCAFVPLVGEHGFAGGKTWTGV